MPTNDKTTPGGRTLSENDRAELERRALAYGLLEQTARRLRSHIDSRLAPNQAAEVEANRRHAMAWEARDRIASSVAERGTLTPAQVNELTEQLVWTDVNCLLAAAASIAPAPTTPTETAA